MKIGKNTENLTATVQVLSRKKNTEHQAHRVHIFTRDETGSVYLPTQLESYTATLLVMVNVIKGGRRAPPPLTSPG